MERPRLLRLDTAHKSQPDYENRHKHSPGEKPFKCVTCQKKFRSAIALALHVKEQHPKAPPVDAQQLMLNFGVKKR